MNEIKDIIREERDQLRAELAECQKREASMREALLGVVNSAVHPDIALRSVMVDLAPIRAALAGNGVVGKNKLDANARHLLRLIRQGKKSDGWTPVSEQVWPLMKELEQNIPELVELCSEGGFVKLTDDGNTVLDYL